MALIMAHALMRNSPGSQRLLCPAVLSPRPGSSPAAVEVSDGDDVLISDALKLAL